MAATTRPSPTRPVSAARPLDTAVGPELATRLLGASELLQRDLAIAAAVAAVRASRLSRPLLEEIVEDLIHHHYDGPRRDEVQRLELALDEHAWTLQERVESEGAPRDEYVQAFRRARAAAAMKMALGADKVAVQGCRLSSGHQWRNIWSNEPKGRCRGTEYGRYGAEGSDELSKWKSSAGGLLAGL